MSNPNGSSTIWRWAFGLLFTALFSVGGYAFTSVSNRVTKLEDDKVPTAEHVATVEAEIEGLRRDVQDLKAAIDRQTDKIDKLEETREGR